MTAPRASERGAVLVYVAVSMFVLIGVTTVVVDYGVMMVGRHQAQNSADAGALAGAIALAYDDFDDRTDTGPAKQAAQGVAFANAVIGESPDVNITTDVTFPPCPNDGSNGCIRVDVYRNQARGNELPMFFGPTVGLTEQGVWATATARAAAANASDCMLPFGIPDKWIDYYDVDEPIEPEGSEAWTFPDDRFEIEDLDPPGATPDYYRAQGTNSEDDVGTGFTLEEDLGQLLVLKAAGPQMTVAPGFFFPVRLPDSTGGNDYGDNIATCNGVPVAVDDLLDNEPGNMVGPTKMGMEALYDQDPNAELDFSDPDNPVIVNSCAQDDPPCAPQSPRLRPLILFDTGVYYEGQTNGLVELRVANIIGFFIKEISPDGEVSGYLMTLPGLFVEGGGTVAPGASFLYTIQLIR